MGTADETPEREDKDDKSFDFTGYVEKGKRAAAIVIVAVAFLQSLYASYIKEADEDVAKENYVVQKQALEQFSNEVDVELAYLRGQIDGLKAVVSGREPKAEVAAALQGEEPSSGDEVEEVVPEPQYDHYIVPEPAEEMSVSEDEGIMTEDAEGFEPEPEPALREEKKAERKPNSYNPRDMVQQRSLKVDLPDAPWEGRKKK